MSLRFCFACLSFMALMACSDKKSKENAGKEQEVTEKFNPGIDTAAITNRESLLEACRQLKSVIEKEEQHKDEPGYKKKYYVILKYKGILSKKMAAITHTIPGNERAAFIKQYREIFP